MSEEYADSYVTLQEASSRTGISKRALSERCKRGTLQARHIRIDGVSCWHIAWPEVLALADELDRTWISRERAARILNLTPQTVRIYGLRDLLRVSRLRNDRRECLYDLESVKAFARNRETPDGYLNPKQAAARLDVSRAGVYTLIYRGLLPSTRIGGYVFVPVAAVERRLRQMRRGL